MLTVLLVAAVLAQEAAAPTPNDAEGGRDCAAAAGWNDGRVGAAARAGCRLDAYKEAHRLGEAARSLQLERVAIERTLAGATPADRDAGLRRQRQIDIDLEALRAIATIRGWPVNPPENPTP